MRKVPLAGSVLQLTRSSGHHQCMERGYQLQIGSHGGEQRLPGASREHFPPCAVLRTPLLQALPARPSTRASSSSEQLLDLLSSLNCDEWEASQRLQSSWDFNCCCHQDAAPAAAAPGLEPAVTHCSKAQAASWEAPGPISSSSCTASSLDASTAVEEGLAAACAMQQAAAGQRQAYRARLHRESIHMKIPFAEPEDLPADFLEKVRGIECVHARHAFPRRSNPFTESCTCMLVLLACRNPCHALLAMPARLMPAPLTPVLAPHGLMQIQEQLACLSAGGSSEGPARAARSAASRGRDGSGCAGGSGRGGGWVMTGAGIRRGCIELVLDLVRTSGGNNNTITTDGAAQAAGAQEARLEGALAVAAAAAAAAGQQPGGAGAAVGPLALAGAGLGLGLGLGELGAGLGQSYVNSGASSSTAGAGAVDAQGRPQLLEEVPPSDWVHWLYLQPPKDAEVLVQVSPRVHLPNAASSTVVVFPHRLGWNMCPHACSANKPRSTHWCDDQLLPFANTNPHCRRVAECLSQPGMRQLSSGPQESCLQGPAQTACPCPTCCQRSWAPPPAAWQLPLYCLSPAVRPQHMVHPRRLSPVGSQTACFS